ncbi:hypothetical protein [Methylobrevis pamukkalensis]|uniref:Uncharacterized protein n=1 Tax=Methylobrevis pamukkalensis TaxID=1439726 RepID=A0A1E3H5I2_9HYPH|nr:hypothetical protein [Methylobrevis pamukkalensis]ODN70781.1 hypothetical protein A6302_01885 [Methylobrevis pamukkalensis]
MPTLRIHDLTGHSLALDLRDLLRVLAPRSLQATWTVSPVRSSVAGREWFDATGNGGEQLEALAEVDARISGADLRALAETTRQVIWGAFAGVLPDQPDGNWVTLRAVDSSFYEITTLDDTVIRAVRAAFNDVRLADAPFG